MELMQERKELTVRERRKIYEDTICVIKQTQKMGDISPKAASGRAIRGLIDKQIDRCTSIICTVLGYNEATRSNEDGTITKVLVPTDEDASYVIDRERFDRIIVPNLPNDRDLRESLWKALIKRDKKAKARLDARLS
jgi:hypothetical protein